MVLLEILQLRTHSIILFYYHYNFIESNLERNNKLASLFVDLKKYSIL